MNKLSIIVFSSLAIITIARPAMSAGTGTYGSLGNFDTVNDTGKEAHGFEIDIEDPTFTKSQITSVFGLDRNFGVPPTSVERYGAPTITDVPGFGVKVVYQAQFDPSKGWSIGTPSGTYPTPGESCWTGGNASYPGNLSCDHFGVGTVGTPAKISYSWLLETSPTSSSLTTSPVGLPVVNFTPTPSPVPNQPPVAVQAAIYAPPQNLENPDPNQWGPAYWLKVYTQNLNQEVYLDQLVKGNAVVPDDNQVETEWILLQAGPGGGYGDDIKDLALNPNDKSVVRRYEFYKYKGLYNIDGSGEAACDGSEAPGHACDNPFGAPGSVGINDLGAYIGNQIGGFNAVHPAAVPEPLNVLGAMTALGLVATLKRKLS